MRAAIVSPEEQHRLIIECKSSGLSDYQWCQLNGIKPGTFYSWVRRFRKEGYPEFQSSEPVAAPVAASKQEVVRLEFGASTEAAPSTNAIITKTEGPIQPVLEVFIGAARLRISNDISTELLKQTLLLTRELSC